MFKWKITKQYIIFRNLIVREWDNKDRKFILFHEDNQSSRQGKKIEEGVVYPLSEEIPIAIQYGNQRKKFSFLDLKGMPNQQIIFENEFAALQYEIYD